MTMERTLSILGKNCVLDDRVPHVETGIAHQASIVLLRAVEAGEGMAASEHNYAHQVAARACSAQHAHEGANHWLPHFSAG